MGSTKAEVGSYKGARELHEELVTDLEAGEDLAVTPLVRKAARLAALLKEEEYRTLFQLHLDGIGPVGKSRVQPLGQGGDQAKRHRASRAVLDDRQVENMVCAFPLAEIERLVRELDSMPDAFLKQAQLHQVLHRVRNRLGLFLAEVAGSLESTAPAAPHQVSSKTKIFIGHGHSPAWRELRDFLQNRLGLECTEFNLVATAGMTTTERLEQMLNEAIFAFLVMTAEDQHDNGSMHARENVIHEVGLCQGRLGRMRAIVLLAEDCAEFSNIKGLGQIRFPPGRIMAASEDIRLVLEREQLLVS